MKTVLSFILLSCPAQAISVANYSDPTNDRFTDDPSFIGAAYDFSGVGRSTNTTSTRWGTLIGENYFLSANHFHPDVGSQIQFTVENSASDPTFTYTVAGGFLVAGTDFWIGYTATTMDLSLARYTYSTTSADTLAETGVSGADVLMSGDRVAGQAGSPSDHTVGTNQLESFRNAGSTAMNTPQATVTFGTAALFDQIVTFENLPGDDTLTFTNYESQVASGDSGSPLFSVAEGSLFLQGTAWAVASLSGNFVDTTGPAGGSMDPLESRNASFYNYIGSYETAIADTISMVPSPVPEPSSTLLSLLSLPLILRRKR